VVGNVNLVVHQMLEERVTPYPVLMTMYRRANGLVIVSLRSRNGEALKIATRLQGGGHPNAAGATLPRSVQQIPDAITYVRQLLDPRPIPAPERDGLGVLFEDVPAAVGG
jgi:nanoRNase/pAp phosphatase (c-di-AMP/oligoRNAs hydrolase)